uniref:Uncharacterized protein n=1 Tax=Brassica campestris TaxID=3711 RepID=M4EB19_BRACM
MVISSSTIDVVLGAMVWFIYPFAFMILTAESHPRRPGPVYWYITETLSDRRPWMEIQHLVNPKKTSAWRMKKRVKNGSTLKIQNESKAKVAATELFQNVAKPGSKFIELGDLTRFLPENDALSFLRIFGPTAEDGTTRIIFPSRLPFIVNERTGISCSSMQHFMMVVKKINFFSVTFVGLDMKEYQISSTTPRSKWRIDLFRGSSGLEKMQLILSESQDATVA